MVPRSRPSPATDCRVERILPVVALAGFRRGGVQLEALPDGPRELLQAGHLVESPAAIGRQRQLDDARRAGVDGVDAALAVEDDHAGGQVVEDGLQVGARTFDLHDAALHEFAGFRQLLGHLRERARQAAEFVARREHGLGAQVAARHLAHAFGQQQQRPRELVAEGDGKEHGTEHRQHEGQRERADVHLAQAVACQRPLLVFAVGGLHFQRIGGQRRRQRLGDEQVVVLLVEAQVRARDEGQRTHPGAAAGRVLVQPFQPADDTGGARFAQQGGRGGDRARASSMGSRCRCP